MTKGHIGEGRTSDTQPTLSPRNWTPASAGVTGVCRKGATSASTPGHTGEGRYPGHSSQPFRKDRTSDIQPALSPTNWTPASAGVTGVCRKRAASASTPGHTGEGRYPGP